MDEKNMVSKQEIFDLVKQFYKENKKQLDFDNVPVAAKVYDEQELAWHQKIYRWWNLIIVR